MLPARPPCIPPSPPRGELPMTVSPVTGTDPPPRTAHRALACAKRAYTPFAVAHQKVVGLDVAVDKVFRVQVFNARNLKGEKGGGGTRP